MIVIAAFVLIIGGYVISSYNRMVSQEEIIKQRWSDVENQYQRRLNLIPNLVQTVKGYATHEKETLEGVVSARAKATQMTVDISNTSSEAFKNFQASQSGLSSALGRLMVVIEKYPDLKADQNFLQLQSQLEGTENRISVEIRRYNESVRLFNTDVRKFPTSIFASLLGFHVYPTFKAEERASKAPVVDFGK